MNSILIVSNREKIRQVMVKRSSTAGFDETGFHSGTTNSG